MNELKALMEGDLVIYLSDEIFAMVPTDYCVLLSLISLHTKELLTRCLKLMELTSQVGQAITSCFLASLEIHPSQNVCPQLRTSGIRFPIGRKSKRKSTITLKPTIKLSETWKISTNL